MRGFPFAIKQPVALNTQQPKSTRNISLGIIFVLIVCVYVLFFLSPMFLSNASSMLYTTLGVAQSIAPKRTVTINSWEYSPKQRKMVVELSMRNAQYDGQNKYRFTAKSRSMSLTELPTSVMLEASDLCVVEISNVPRDYNEVMLGVIIDSEKYDNAAIPLYTNKFMITEVEGITAKTETEYRITSLERTISGYNASIDEQKGLINEAEIRIENIMLEIETAEQEKKYMTAAEMQDANRSINESKSRISQERNAIDRAKDTITEYESRIILAYTEINDLKGESKIE